MQLIAAVLRLVVFQRDNISRETLFQAEFDGKLVSIPGVRASTLRCLSISVLGGDSSSSNTRAFIPRGARAMADHAVGNGTVAREVCRELFLERREDYKHTQPAFVAIGFPIPLGSVAGPKKGGTKPNFASISAVICSLVRIDEISSSRFASNCMCKSLFYHFLLITTERNGRFPSPCP